MSGLRTIELHAMATAADKITDLSNELESERQARENANDMRHELDARIEKAADILRGHFFQQRYVGTVPQAVVSEALAVLEGEP